jgi:hypothetical protein
MRQHGRAADKALEQQNNKHIELQEVQKWTFSNKDA